MESEVFLFPIEDEEFKVDSTDAYVHLMHFIISTATELQIDYPEKTVWVTYRIPNGQ